MADETKKEQDSNEELLSEIREDFRYHKEYWRESHDEAAKDMDAVACIPPVEFKEDRKGRPCLWPDEISQYVKQANNSLRQNKRSTKISPKTEDATNDDAEHRQAYIRGIEDASKAQSIYTTASEACIQCSVGFWRLKTIITGPKGEQEPRICRIPNQFSVYPDPDALEADFSDGNKCFVLGPAMRPKAFEKRYPNAKKRSFTADDVTRAPDWFNAGNVVPAEYWKRKEIDKDDGEARYKVTQYITNGVEILETNEWIGSWIPIIGVFGEELYIRSSGQVKRLFLSLVRRARAPQQMLAYIASQEAEEFGMAPRAPMLVVEGSVDPEKWKFAHKVPTAYLEYKIPMEWNAAQMGPFPGPSRNPFTPNAQAYELSRESWRRAIQSAMGITPLPTSAQRQNEKSGVALEKIQNQEAVGSFHFTDNFVRALNNSGRQLNELITKLAELDSLPKQLLGKNQKDEDMVLKVAARDMAPQDAASEQLPEAKYFFAHRGQFEVTISDGPNYQSERDEASAFADTLLSTLPSLGLPPQITQEILAIAVKLKNIGTYGQEIADLLSPPDPSNLPPQAKALLAQAQAQVQQAQAEVQQLRIEKLGKVIETKGKMDVHMADHITRMTEADKDRETKVLVAEITTKAQNLSERMTAFEDLMKQWHTQAHDLAMTIQQHNQAKEMAAQNVAIQPAGSPPAAGAASPPAGQ